MRLRTKNRNELKENAMAVPYFPIYHTAPTTASGSSSSAPLSVKSKLNHRTISISSGKSKAVRKAKHLAKRPASSCAWYEAEDRTLPSVSSF